jgi:hypothetical protein
MRTIALVVPVTVSRVKPTDIGGVIAALPWLSCVPDTQHAPAFVPDCIPMTKDQFIAAYITTRARAKWFPFGNNFTPRFR